MRFSTSFAAGAAGLLAFACASMPLLASASVFDYTYCVNYGYPNMGDCASMGYGSGGGYNGGGYGGGYNNSYPYYDNYYQQPVTYYQPKQQYYYPYPDYYYYPQPSYSYNYGAPIVTVNSGIYYGGYGGYIY